jgi:hypothetical protein
MKLLPSLVLGSAIAASALALAVACSSDPAASNDEADAKASVPDSSHVNVPDSSSANDGNTTTDAGADADADLTPEERGAAVATTLGCHSCHDSTAGVMAGNNTGISGTVDGGTTTIYPANVTPDPDTGIGPADGGWTDDQITRAVRTGVDDQCLTLCSAMPHFTVSDDDMTALIAYLRSLTPVANDVSNQGCPDVDASASGAGMFVDAGDCP